MEQETETETADPSYALEIARYLLGSHPHKPHDPEILLEQLTTLFSGKPRWLLRWMVHPERGVLAEADFVPSVALCGRWLKQRTVGRPDVPEHTLLPPAEERPESQELKDAAIARWREQRRRIAARLEQAGPRGFAGSSLTPEENAAIAAYCAEPSNP